MSTIIYLVELALLLTLAAIIYRTVFHNDKNFDIARRFILINSVLSIVIPALPVYMLFANPTYAVLLETVVIGVQESSASLELLSRDSISILSILTCIWVVGAAYYIVPFAYSFFRLYTIAKQSKRLQYRDSIVYISDQVSVPFSFGDFIYLPSNVNLYSAEFDTIYHHERLHGEFGHTRDKVFMLLVRVVLWWHPVSHYFLNQMNLIHEYQVDKQIISTTERKSYVDFLSKYTAEEPQLALASTISSQIKQRIIMMYSTQSETSNTTVFLSIALMSIGSMLLHACTTEATSDTTSKDTITAKSYQTTVSDTIISFDMETKQEVVKIVNQDKTIYLEPETLPLFPGCEGITSYESKLECSNEKLLQYVYKNIKYPKEARDAGIEGMVVVQFIVDHMGYITEEKIVKSVGYGIDKEVLRLVKSMGGDDAIRFEPGKVDGKAVDVEYKLPVKFKLQ